MVIDEKQLTRGELTRLSILDTAERLFLKNGYNGTSMRQIARGARIALGGIYNHFESKEDIFRTLLDERIPYPEIAKTLAAISDTTGPQMLREAFTRLLALTRERSDHFALLLTDVREFRGSTVREQSGKLIPALAEFVQRVQAAGGLRPEVNGVILMRLLMSLLIGYMITDLIITAADTPLLPDMPTDQQALTGVQDILLNGVTSVESEG